MKLSELVYHDEIVNTEIPYDTEIGSLTVNADSADETALLLLYNQKALKSYTHNCKIKYVLCDADIILPPTLHAIRVQNIRKTIANVCSRFYNCNYSEIKIIGITGSNGKTTTAKLITKILEYTGYRVGFIGTGRISIGEEILSDDYYSMTTPDPWVLYKIISQMIKSKCQYIVMEVSSIALALEKVSPIPFSYAIFTNLSKEHLDLHGNLEAYYLAKRKLIESADNTVINADDYYGRRMMKEISQKCISVGVLWKADIRASDIKSNQFNGSSFIYHGNNFCTKIILKLPGLYNIYNCLEAIALCNDLGISPRIIKDAIVQIHVIEGRYEIIKADITVIIDYAHTPYALESILKDINSIQKADQKLTVVFGCGGERDAEKRPAMAKIAERYADYTYVTADNSRNENTLDIIGDIIKGFEGNLYEIIPDRKSAIRYAIINAGVGDIVAIIGKGSEKYNIDKNGCQPFNENEIIKEAIRDRS